MAKFQSFLDIFKKNSELEYLFDLDLVDETSDRAYLKRMALDTVLDYVGRAVSQSEFRTYKENKLDRSSWHYKLNVRPNTDMSATTFWQKFVYKLIYDNEVLVVVSDTDDLLIADSFVRKGYALYEDVFTEVIVKDYKFERPFRMSEVIHIEYKINKLNHFLDGLYSDYGEILGRMIDVSLRNHQIRGTVDIEQTSGFDTDTQEKLQRFVDRLFTSFSKNSVAIVPQTKNLRYNEVSSGERTDSQTFNDITKLKSEFITDVAKAVGVPPALVHGEMVDLTENRKAFMEFCVKPLNQKIEDELNAKLFAPEEYIKGDHIEVVGVDRPNIFELATSVDKLIGSGPFSLNEIRVLLGFEPIDDERMDRRYITKNYTEMEELKGGEEN